MNQALNAFDAEGRALIKVVTGLSPTDLERPTNCPPWTLAELVIHIAGSIRIGDFAPAPAGELPRETADYYRRPERGTAEYRDHNVLEAQRVTRQVLGHTTVADHLSGALNDAMAKMIKDDFDRVVEISRVGPMRLGAWLVTRVISLAAHGLDVAITLEATPWTTPAAATLMRPVFESLLGQDLPAELGWTEQRLLATATGRAPLTQPDRTILGAAADRFPLLS